MGRSKKPFTSIALPYIPTGEGINMRPFCVKFYYHVIILSLASYILVNFTLCIIAKSIASRTNLTKLNPVTSVFLYCSFKSMRQV